MEEPAENTPFDVILVTHGRLDLTIRALTSLYGHTTTPFQLIVVDDSDPNDPDPETSLTVPFFEKYQKLHDNVKFIHSEKPYKCGNQIFNIGLKEAKHDLVAVVMNSICVEPAWEKVALRFMTEHPDVGVVGLKCIELWGPIESAGIFFNGIFPIDRGQRHPSHRFTSIKEMPAVAWALAILRKEAAVGNLAEDIYHGFRGVDDIDNCFVLRKKGYKVFYCGYGAGYHEQKATRGSDSMEVGKQNQENKNIFYKRWGMWKEYKKTMNTR